MAISTRIQAIFVFPTDYERLTKQADAAFFSVYLVPSILHNTEQTAKTCLLNE